MRPPHERTRAEDIAMMREMVTDVLGGAAAGGVAMFWTALSHTGLAALLREQNDPVALVVLGAVACAIGGLIGFLAFLFAMHEK